MPDSASGHRYSTAELQALGAESSERERRADDASRDVMGYLKCLYLQPRIGESFEATVTSALEFGLFVQLKEMPIDGLVHISKLPGDYWELDSGGMGLVGRRTGRRWRMGDAVEVRLSRVDLMQRQIDFELVEGGAGSHADAGASQRPRRTRLRRTGGAAAARRGVFAPFLAGRRPRPAWLRQSAISSTACTPSAPSSSARPSGCSSSGWPSRVRMRGRGR